MKIRKASAVAAAVLLCSCLAGATAKAEEGKTLTLSGHIEGDYICPEDVEKIILAGVDMEEGSTLEIRSETELRIEDGTENNLYLIVAGGMTDITGGGTLNLSFGILAYGYDVMFDHSGDISINGTVVGIDADIICNSGSIHISSPEEGQTSVSCADGSVILNGGEVDIRSGGIGIATTKDLALNGGSVRVQSEEAAFMAAGMTVEEDRLPEGAAVQEVSGTDGDYFTITDISTGDTHKTVDIASDDAGEEARKAQEEFAQRAEAARAEREEARKTEEAETGRKESEADSGAEITGDSEELREETAGSAGQKEETGQRTGILPIVILILVIVGIAAAAGAGAVISGRRSNKKRRT